MEGWTSGNKPDKNGVYYVAIYVSPGKGFTDTAEYDKSPYDEGWYVPLGSYWEASHIVAYMPEPKFDFEKYFGNGEHFTPMTDYEKLAKNAKALAEKATAGPWEAWTDVLGDACVAHGNPSDWMGNVGDSGLGKDKMTVIFDIEKKDAEFIAASRTLVPELADAVLVLSKALEIERGEK